MSDIRRALEAKLWYLALSVALSIPDICSSAEEKREPGAKIWKGTETRYTKWCETYLIPKFHFFTATDCWALRGGVIHNGKLHGHPKQQYDRIVFTPPNDRIMMHENISRNNGGIIESALQMDLVRFCELMIQAAHEFVQAKGEEPIVRENLENLVRLRPTGIVPHFVGMPVIA